MAFLGLQIQAIPFLKGVALGDFVVRADLPRHDVQTARQICDGLAVLYVHELHAMDGGSDTMGTAHLHGPSPCTGASDDIVFPDIFVRRVGSSWGVKASAVGFVLDLFLFRARLQPPRDIEQV